MKMKQTYVKGWDQFISTLNEEELSAEQKAYQKFFKEKLADYDVKSPDELDDSEKKKFFSEIKKEWPDAEGNKDDDKKTNESRRYSLNERIDSFEVETIREFKKGNIYGRNINNILKEYIFVGKNGNNYEFKETSKGMSLKLSKSELEDELEELLWHNADQSTNESRRYSLNEGMNLKVSPEVEKASDLEIKLNQEVASWRYVIKPLFVSMMNVDIKSVDDFDIELTISNGHWITATARKGKYSYLISNKYGTETYYKEDEKLLQKYFKTMEIKNILEFVFTYYEGWLKLKI